MGNWLKSHGLIIFVLIMITMILLKVIITGISNWSFYKKRRKFELHKLNEIVKKGYPWAKISQEITDFYNTENSPYVSAKKEAVQFIGVLPNRKAIYKTESGKVFYYYDKNLLSVIVDVAGNVYRDHGDEDNARLVDNRLVITNNKQLIIPNNFRIINNSQEAKDFLDFRSYLASYFDFQVGDGMLIYAKIIELR